ncbi:acyl-CoA-binding protein [Testicularia cyperi]|uniref:Acyl-CoA-binding protein n=1 Tax=Testicularia cyperi TaxID=1882483 RepID=A0A317XQ22_9BASI|nr:acyl-CoA-binding protein [Testicularia cyperi]
MSVEAKFNKAVSIVGSLPKDGPVQPTQEDQLKFYSYYKQATVGDVNTSRPGMLDFVGKAKWDAWKKVEGMSKEAAQQAYVENLLEILKKHEGEGDSAKHIQEIESA